MKRNGGCIGGALPREPAREGPPPPGVFLRPLSRFPMPRSLGAAGFPRIDRVHRRVWFAFSVTHPDFHLATLLLDLDPLTVSGLYLHDRREGRTWTWTRPVLGGRFGRVAPGPFGETSHVRVPGHRVVFRHLLEHGRHEISLDVSGGRGVPSIRAEFAMREDLAAIPSLAVRVPAPEPWFMYTHKAFGPAEGFVRLGDRRLLLSPDRDLASLDEHRAAWPLDQRWTWATWGGRLPDGRLLAVNLCDNSHYLDPEGANENRLWIGNRMVPLGAVRFEFEPDRPLRRWRIRESRDRADLLFRPEGIREDRLCLGLIGLRYFQVCGCFTGRLVAPGGEVIEVRDRFGVCEHGVVGPPGPGERRWG
ncbi:DUF2804 domain-containing protein [Myxococcota bacterium]|nr:DUF2804 domain-containing protein [Myxococcota bacterium]